MKEKKRSPSLGAARGLKSEVPDDLVQLHSMTVE